ncbi:MAG: hypothetical protein ACI35O_08145 [Bacillaceae bacterium]
MEITKDDLFFCYDVQLHNRLRESGVRYLCACIAASTNQKFWLYARSEKVEEVLRNK